MTPNLKDSFVVVVYLVVVFLYLNITYSSFTFFQSHQHSPIFCLRQFEREQRETNGR